MKKLVTNYTFDKTARTIVFTDYTTIDLSQILLITNTTSNIIIYNFASLGGSVTGNTLTLTYDTSLMNNNDSLQIFYEDGIYNSYDVDGNLLVTQNVENPFHTKFGQEVISPSETFWGRLARIGKFRTNGLTYTRTGIATTGVTSQPLLYLQANLHKVLYIKEVYMRIVGGYPKVPIIQTALQRGHKASITAVDTEYRTYFVEKNKNGNWEMNFQYDGDVYLKYPYINDGNGGYYVLNLLSGKYNTGGTNIADPALVGYTVYLWWNGYEVEDNVSDTFDI